MRRKAAVGAAALALASLGLAGCGGKAAPPPDEPTSTVPAEPAPAPSPMGAANASEQAAPPALIAEAGKDETGARNVLLEWARDLERGDYDGAYALWLDGARSGLTQAEHAAFWSRFQDLTVSVPEGTIEGAAGSLYYEVPLTVTGRTSEGKVVRREGTVVLRRVNDVPGATPAQLRWHLESVDLPPGT